MRDANRDAIRQVLKPSMYPLLLCTEYACYCSNCTSNHVYELLADLRSGVANSYTVINTANTDEAITCEVCGERITWLDDLSEDPHEAEMRDAADSLFDSEY